MRQRRCATPSSSRRDTRVASAPPTARHARAGKSVARDAFAPLLPGPQAGAPGRAEGVAPHTARLAPPSLLWSRRHACRFRACWPEGTWRRGAAARGGEFYGRPPRAAERNEIPPFVSATMPAEAVSTQALAPRGPRPFQGSLTEIVLFAAPSRRCRAAEPSNAQSRGEIVAQMAGQLFRQNRLQ